MKFKLGEIAISINHNPVTLARYGTECECTIVEIGPFKACIDTSRVNGNGFQCDSDYLIQMSDGEYYGAPESRLRKRPGKDDNLFTEWFNEHIITDPIAVPERSLS